MSRCHALVRLDGDGTCWVSHQAGTRRDTFINGRPLKPRVSPCPRCTVVQSSTVPAFRVQGVTVSWVLLHPVTNLSRGVGRHSAGVQRAPRGRRAAPWLVVACLHPGRGMTWACAASPRTRMSGEGPAVLCITVTPVHVLYRPLYRPCQPLVSLGTGSALLRLYVTRPPCALRSVGARWRLTQCAVCCQQCVRVLGLRAAGQRTTSEAAGQASRRAT